MPSPPSTVRTPPPSTRGLPSVKSSPVRSDGAASDKADSESSVRVSPIDTPMRLTLPMRRPAFVHRETTTHDLVVRAGLTTYPPPEVTVQLPAAEPRAPRPNLLGVYTRYKPFYLLGMGAAGNWLYGTGTVALERGLFARRPLAPPGGVGPTLPPSWQPLFGDRAASIGLGAASAAGGAFLALASCGLFYQDARRLSRRQNPANPSYTRANAYLAAHLTGIALSIGSKFLTEALRDLVSHDVAWAAVVPGQIGQALFAVTQAQAFSNCELVTGKMPLTRRGEIGFAARFFVGLYSVYGVLQGIPYLSSYGKEVVRLSAVTAATLAYSLPLTTARMERHAKTLPAPLTPGGGPKDSWHALWVLSGFFVGRTLAGFGPDMLQRGVHASHAGAAFSSSAGQAFGGATMLATGTGVCVASIMLFRQDAAAYDLRKANTWAALAFVALLLVEAYRGIFETGLLQRDMRLVYLACLPGVAGTGLRLAVLPELFCYSELYRGSLPLKARYQWTEACRAGAQLLFGVWGATCAVPDFNPYAREAIGVTAGILATLGMALPTTTSRRAMPQYAWPLSPGMTPTFERGDPFALLPLPALAG